MARSVRTEREKNSVARSVDDFIQQLRMSASEPGRQLPIELSVSCFSSRGATNTTYSISAEYVNGILAFHNNAYMVQSHDDKEERLNPGNVRSSFMKSLQRGLASGKPPVIAEINWDGLIVRPNKLDFV